jgi:hypothetical protein
MHWQNFKGFTKTYATIPRSPNGKARNAKRDGANVNSGVSRFTRLASRLGYRTFSLSAK